MRRLFLFLFLILPVAALGAGELKHADVGSNLTEAEWEAVDTHEVDGGTRGDLLRVNSDTNISRLAISATPGAVLTSDGTDPEWLEDVLLTDGGVASTSGTLTTFYTDTIRSSTGSQAVDIDDDLTVDNVTASGNITASSGLGTFGSVLSNGAIEGTVFNGPDAGANTAIAMDAGDGAGIAITAADGVSLTSATVTDYFVSTSSTLPLIYVDTLRSSTGSAAVTVSDDLDATGIVKSDQFSPHTSAGDLIFKLLNSSYDWSFVHPSVGEVSHITSSGDWYGRNSVGTGYGNFSSTIYTPLLQPTPATSDMSAKIRNASYYFKVLNASDAVLIRTANSGLTQINASADGYALTMFNDGDADTRKGLKIIAGADSGTSNTYVYMCDGNGDIAGAISHYSGTLDLWVPSDRTLKTGITETTKDALSKLRAIPVRDYVYRDDLQTTVTGFVADELKAVVPEAVMPVAKTREEWTTRTVATYDAEAETTQTTIQRERHDIPTGETLELVSRAALVPYLVKALQQQQEQIDALEARIEALEKAGGTGRTEPIR